MSTPDFFTGVSGTVSDLDPHIVGPIGQITVPPGPRGSGRSGYPDSWSRRQSPASAVFQSPPAGSAPPGMNAIWTVSAVGFTVAPLSFALARPDLLQARARGRENCHAARVLPLARLEPAPRPSTSRSVLRCSRFRRRHWPSCRRTYPHQGAPSCRPCRSRPLLRPGRMLNSRAASVSAAWSNPSVRFSPRAASVSAAWV